MHLTLQRDHMDKGAPTLGQMAVDGFHICDTLELPWKDNQRGISCIPAGVYPITLRDSDKFRRVMIHVEDVPGRSGILFHPANEVGELRGCIAGGTRINVAPDQLRDSRAAVAKVEAKVREALAREEAVYLEIRNPVVA